MAAISGFRGSILCVLFALLGIFSYSTSARKLHAPPERSSSLEVVKRPGVKPQQISTTELYASAFLKHKKRMPAALKTAYDNLKKVKGSTADSTTDSTSYAASRRRATLISTADTAYFYTALVRWGTPQQSTYLMIDTGSWDVWVYSWLMDVYASFDLTGHNIYNATLSSTAAEMSGQTIQVCYGAGGCVWGDMWQDWIWVDDLGVEGNPVPAIWYEETTIFGLTGIDGIFGLATAYYDSEAPDPQQTWTSYVLPQLAQSLFTITLIQGGGGSIDFGTIDSSKYTGSIAYSAVTSIPGTTTSFWAFNWSGFRVGPGTSWNTTSFQFLCDTGISISTLPPSIVSVFWSQVTGAVKASDGSWSYPCGNPLPDITIGVGTDQVVIRGSKLTGGPTSVSGYCYGSLQPGTETDYQIFGWQFYTSLFVIHDYGNMRMGFGNRTT